MNSHRIKQRQLWFSLLMLAGFLINPFLEEITAQINDELNISLIESAKNGNLDEVKKLISKGANVNVFVNGFSPLMAAAGSDSNTEIIKELIENGADVNLIEPSKGGTALFISAIFGNTEITKELIVNGADVNAKTRDSTSILKAASTKEHLGIVKILISAGVNVDSKDKYGWTSLMLASEKGYIDLVKELIAAGANINATGNGGWSSLMAATKEGHIKVVKELISGGARINIKDDIGWTALILASNFNHSEIAKILITQGANVNALDKKNETALIISAKLGHIEIVKLLLENGADEKVADIDGDTALTSAKKKGYIEIVNLLKKSELEQLSISNNIDLSKEGNIYNVQKTLQSKGYDPGPLDGVIGDKTVSAIREFQKDNNLNVSGKLDINTLSLLGTEMQINSSEVIANSVGYVLKNSKTENPYLVEGIGKMKSVLNLNKTEINLEEPTIWIFGSVPSELAGEVEQNGAYFQDGEKWKFVRFIDSDLSPEEAATLFGISSKNTILIVKSF